MHGFKSAILAKLKIESELLTYLPQSCARLKPWHFIDTNKVQIFMATNTQNFKASHLFI